MLGSSHIRFTPEIEWSNSYHFTNIYSYWLDWLVLRDILKTACNITDATNKGVGSQGRVEGEDAGWANDALRHRRPSYAHSGPDRWPQQPLLNHKLSRHAMGQNWNPSYSINAPQGPHRVYYGPSLLDRVDNRPSVKADLLISIPLLLLCLDSA